jgi:cytochrome c oxidase cbb3-type subunit 3
MNNPPDHQLEPSEIPLDDDPIRAHVFDGDIREYDKCMPNWWLFTFWGAVAFSFGYWVWNHEFGMERDPGLALKEQMAENVRLASRQSGVLDDNALWAFSKDPVMVSAGKATFTTTCATCHMPDLAGGIGPNLKDTAWLHGGNPLQIMETISKGVLEKGMPAWGPMLGRQKITEVAAFILSHHQQGEPIQQAPPFVPAAAPTAVTAGGAN